MGALQEKIAAWLMGSEAMGGNREMDNADLALIQIAERNSRMADELRVIEQSLVRKLETMIMQQQTHINQLQAAAEEFHARLQKMEAKK